MSQAEYWLGKSEVTFQLEKHFLVEAQCVLEQQFGIACSAATFTVHK